MVCEDVDLPHRHKVSGSRLITEPTMPGRGLDMGLQLRKITLGRPPSCPRNTALRTVRTRACRSSLTAAQQAPCGSGPSRRSSK